MYPGTSRPRSLLLGLWDPTPRPPRHMVVQTGRGGLPSPKGRTNRRGTRETARTRTFRGGPRITTGMSAVCRLDAAAHASSKVFLMHSQPNGECACRCLETEASQLSFKKVNLCRGARQVSTLTRLIAMAPIDDATKYLSHELLWAPAAPAQRTKVGRAPLAPE